MDHLNVWADVSEIVEKYTYVFPNGAEVDIPNPLRIFRREDNERLIICTDGSVITISSSWIYARTVFTKEYLDSKKVVEYEDETTRGEEGD